MNTTPRTEAANQSPNHPSSKANFGLIRDAFLARLCPSRGARPSRNLLILNTYGQPSRRTVNLPVRGMHDDRPHLVR